MIKAKIKNKNIFIIIIIFVTILFLGLVFKTSFNNSYVNTPNQSVREYSSKFLKFKIFVPSDYKIEDKEISVTLIREKKEINIVRNGTNFSNLEDYLVNFDSKRNINISDENQLEIDGYSSVSRTVSVQDENIIQKSYYIFVGKAVYIISTSSPELYEDLDQIARSFKYTP